jgi:murein DD-endopeptidase MepM/ murein hydrolase activator NlpD
MEKVGENKQAITCETYIVDENGEKKKGLFSKISSAKEGLANKFAEKPGFMKGFTKAYRDRKDAEKKASLKEQAAPTTTALQEAGVPEIKSGVEEIVDTIGQIKDALTGKDPKGIVEEVKVQFSELKDKLDEESKEIQDSADGGGEELASNALEATQAEVTDITTNGGALGGVEGAVTTGATLMTGGAGGGAAGAAGEAAAGAAEAGAGEGAGAAMGGMMNVLMGISNIVLTIVMSLEGFKAMISTVTDILTEALMPLNDAFHAIIKTLKPYVKQLGSIVKQLAGFIVQIVEVVCDIIQPIMKDVIQPILEVLSPLLESIIGCLTPLLKIVGILLKVILAPLMGLFKFVLLPILKIIGDAVQIIMGVLQIGFGVLMMGIGGIITAIGTVISAVGKLIPGVGKLGSGIKDSGKSMMKEGGDFVAQGLKQVAQGTVNLVLDYASLYSMGMSDELLGRNEEEKKETKQIEAPDGNQVESTFANGDVTNVYNTYGGEYQRGMGGYLNMNQRGCGPIALADMYNRNSEGRISARSLAGMMNQSGAYDPHRGTSVGDYIDTARGLGMNVHAGKVTQQSLKSASPTNPITVVGSGSDYGTRNGNNHFMNVVGTDHHGGAYVSNPLTGRIDRRPASTVAGSAVMGIYGSGDEEEGGYTFPEAIKEAFKKLKEEAAKILGLFSMEKSEEEETEDTINAERKKSAAEQAKKQLMNDDPDGYAEIEEAAKAKAKEDYFIKKYPQRDNESDEEYQERFDEWWEGDADQAKWLTESGQFADALKKAKGNSKAAWQELAKKSNEFVEGYANQFEELGKQADAAEEGLGSSGGNGSGGYFTSQGGNARLALDNPEITDIDMTDVDSSIGDGGGYSHAPVLEFFKKTGGAQSFLYGYNMYNQYGTSSPSDHTKEGVGTAGSTHQGIDLHWIGESAEGKIPVYAPTDGKLQLAQPEALAAGGGNYVSMIDNEGNRHRFMHMHHFSDEIKNMKFGDQIIGGKTILGYEGNTGDSTGTHTHWDIYEDGGSGKRLNPLTYFSNYVPSSNLEGGTDEEKIWAYLTSHGLEKHAAAGAMGAFQVESANNPDTLEGYYAFGDGSRSNSVVKEAMKSFDSMDDYVVNKLFPMYDRSGKSINKPGYKGADGHYYPGLGLAQWTGDRTVALSKYTVGKGLGWNDLGGQLDYLKHELDTNSYYSGAVTEMNNSNDVNRATEIWLAKFEGNPGDALSERQKYANDFYNRFKDWTPQTKQTYTPTGSGSASTGYGMVNSAADARMVDNYNQIKTTSGKNTGTVLTGGDDLNMRADKSIDSSVLITIPNGTKLNLEASGSAGWFKTTWGGKTGYVSSEYIILDNDDANNFDYSGGLQDKSTDTLLTNYAKEATGQNVDGELNMINPIMWDADNWLAPKSNATERKKWYAQLAQIHSNAIKNNQLAYTQKYKDAWTWNWQNGQKVTPDNPDYWQSMTVQMSGDQHYSNLGSGKSNVDLTWNGVKDEAYAGGNSLLKKWKKGKDVKAYKGNGVYADAIKKRLGTQLGEINGLRKDWSSWTYGSGDEPMSELDFWDSYLGWNNKYANSNITTPVNNDLYDTDTYYDTETGTTVVNNYAVTRAEDRATDARLKAVLANTYNVRSESMEALLEAILEEIKRRKDGNPGPTNTSGSSKLFDERIPSQVTKLSVG